MSNWKESSFLYIANIHMHFNKKLELTETRNNVQGRRNNFHLILLIRFVESRSPKVWRFTRINTQYTRINITVVFKTSKPWWEQFGAGAILAPSWQRTGLRKLLCNKQQIWRLRWWKMEVKYYCWNLVLSHILIINLTLKGRMKAMHICTRELYGYNVAQKFLASDDDGWMTWIYSISVCYPISAWN